MLTREAWNALLKILEEPPPRVVFVFATTEPQKIAQQAAPVLSRLQRFDLKRIGLGDIRSRLESVLTAEGVESSPEALAMIARSADGSMRDALSLADQVISIGGGPVSADRVREALGLVPEDEYIEILGIVKDHRAGDVFAAVTRLSEGGVDFGVFLTGFAEILRAQLAAVLGGSVQGISARAEEALRAQKDGFAPGDLLRMLSAISSLEQSFRKSSQQQLLVEMMLVRLALMDRTIEIEDLLKGLAGGEKRDDATALPAGAPVRTPRREPPPAAPAPPRAPTGRSAEPTARSTEKLQEARRVMDETAQGGSKRLTAEALKEERIGILRRNDPALGAAIDALDLELLD